MRGDSASVASDMVAARANGMHCPIPALKAATLIMTCYTQPGQLQIE